MKFLNKRILSMAKSLVEVRREIYGYNSIRNEHLLKCYVFPDNLAFKHWCGEIAAFPREVSVLKGRNRRPTPKQLYDWLWLADDWDSYRVECYVENLNYSEKYPKIESVNSQKVLKFLDSYYLWLSEALSTRGSVRNIEVGDKIQELLKKI